MPSPLLRLKRGAMVLCISLSAWLTACDVDKPAPVVAEVIDHCEPVGDAVQAALVEARCLKLSSYRFFSVEDGTVLANEGVLPYDLTTPLFSDYSQKTRFVWMPAGTSAGYVTMATLDFPVGTVLLKTFGYDHDFNAPALGHRILETRLLVHGEQGWFGLPYIWNEDQSEAYLEITGDVFDVSWRHIDGAQREIDYTVPNANQCKGCHVAHGKMDAIGPKARYLNRDYDYGDLVENQIDRWVRAGYLKDASASVDRPRGVVWDDPDSGTLNERARAYLDINCAHCHNPQGPARTSGLFLGEEETNPLALGVCKTPVAAGRGSGGLRFDIVPRDPAASILVFRMLSTDPAIMMPEIGRSVAHTEGVELIRRWILAMTDADCPPPQ